MQESEVQAIVDAHIKPMMRLLGVQAWRIAVRYEAESEDHPDWVASCDRHTSYQRATIRIDPARHDTAAEVLDSLRHELIHVVLSPFDAYRALATANIKAGSAMDAAEDRAWEAAIELSVLAVERIFDWGLKERGNPEDTKSDGPTIASQVMPRDASTLTPS
jgi:hypothetical protein